jgi:hypothetical protein
MKSVSKFASLALAAATLLPLVTATSADAQQRRGRRPAIVVTPPEKVPHVDWYDPLRWRDPTPAEARALSRYTRSCTDWYALEHRPSGTVLTPQMRCRWVRR